MGIVLLLVIVAAGFLVYAYLGRRKLEKALKEKVALIQDAEAQLIQMEKMASVGTMAAGIAHEINNPLSFLISNLDSLKEYLRALINNPDCGSQLAKTFSEDFLPMAEESLEGALRIKKIVSDLRTFSRQSESQKIPTDITQVLESTLSIIWNEIKYKITVIKDFKASSTVSADPTQLSQVFLNLLLNASQAIAEKGTITITTYEDQKYVYIKIKDSGCGIPKEVLPKIFDPFFSTKKMGSGLGLSVSYNIIKQHQGDIKVESAPAQGTAFTISMPKNGNQRENQTYA